MARIIEVEVTVPEGLKEGDKFKVQVQLPEVERKTRGCLAGIALEDMSDEQLKREITNANSVLYKAKQRNADPATIEANQARVDAAKAEQAKRQGTKVTVQATAVAEVLEGDNAEPTDSVEEDTNVYNEETAAEM